MEKDYSLLRPFDLEAAKRGDKICWKEDGEEASNVFFVGKYVIPVFSTCFNNEQVGMFGPADAAISLAMAPLAWVEGKPVYLGDVLYYTKNTGRMDGPIEMHITSSDKHGLYGDTVLGDFVGNFDNITWKKPKTKREGWVNIYPDTYAFHYKTKEKADEIASEDRIACIRIEWEE